MACPGSVRLARLYPEGSNTTIYAQEGTAAHALAETCLRKGGVDPIAFLGDTFEGVEVTEQMVDAVRVYVDFCRSIIEDSDEFWVEKKFDLAAFDPPAPMFGTADFVAYNAAARMITVVDLKYGQGVVVEATGNPQLRYYGLGTAVVMTGYPIERVRMVIVQPRAQHPDGSIREDAVDLEELIAFAGELLDAARATQAPDAPLNPGDHCRFCPAAAVCPARAKQAMAVAQAEFDAVPAVLPPAPETLTIAQIAEFLPKLDILEEWIGAVRAHARAMLDRGEEVPGAKLVAKRAQRKWTDEAEAQRLLRERGYKDDEIQKMEIKSPAQIEKLLGKKAFGQLMGELVEKKSSGLVMVAADDPRPAVVVTAGEEFLALPSGSDEE